jgi:hypothetical protein
MNILDLKKTDGERRLCMERALFFAETAYKCLRWDDFH